MSISKREDWQFSVSSRRLSSEMSIHHLSSGEVYYGGASVAVPFKWESQPGTPRVRFRETPLPPLTPPPSFLFGLPNASNKKISKKGIFHAVFPRLTSTRKNPISASSESSSSSLFSPSWYSDSTSFLYIRNNHTQNRRRSFEDQDGLGSPVSTSCFRMMRRSTPKPLRSM
ncbi:hypothetical protein QVD17_17453 [Tagetes erecta]|uniref:Uncharacterized protein n=1 Tax=Tagetes erecta TaxID=13708 RepID=A0AAD8P1F5_TARER|nr:hypothetical protein QVD17_17453 [Tagetes erecta]